MTYTALDLDTEAYRIARKADARATRISWVIDISPVMCANGITYKTVETRLVITYRAGGETRNVSVKL